METSPTPITPQNIDNINIPANPVYKQPKKSTHYLLLIIISLVVSFLLFCLAFYFLVSSNNLFTEKILQFAHLNNILFSPLSLNNPRILRSGAGYVLTAKITKIEQTDTETKFNIDIPGIPQLTASNRTQVAKSDGQVFDDVRHKELAPGQDIQIALIYDLADKNYNVLKIVIK